MLEEERKYEVSPRFALPDLTSALPTGGRVVSQPPVSLRATYYDTADLRLARSGASLRFRRGDSEPWTVKLPTDVPGQKIDQFTWRTADAWAEGAWIFNEQGKHDIAVKAANKALDTDSDHSNALREKGYALMKMGKHKDAVKCLYNAIESNKKNWTAYDYLAQALDNLGEKKLAKEVRTLKTAEQDNE